MIYDPGSRSLNLSIMSCMGTGCGFYYESGTGWGCRFWRGWACKEGWYSNGWNGCGDWDEYEEYYDEDDGVCVENWSPTILLLLMMVIILIVSKNL